MTESSISVTPRSLSWSRFSISVQPIWTFRSNRVAVTACDSASRCHRVVPLGHTDRVGIYISTGEILEISSNSSARACVLLCLLGSPDRLLAASDLPPLVSITVNGNLLHRCRRSKFTDVLGYELDTLCYSSTPITSRLLCHDSFHIWNHHVQWKHPAD